MEQHPPEFYMTQFWMDLRRLAALGKMMHLPLKKVSNSYLVHCALSELFQQQAPSVFCLEDHHRYIGEYNETTHPGIRVLGYTDVDTSGLQEIAKGFASPQVYHILQWDHVLSKPMPAEYPSGMKLGFELRACPVVRKASDGNKWRKGQEMDAFLARVLEVNDDQVTLKREDVYNEWLSRLLDQHSAARLISSQLKRFSLERMSRRTQGENRKMSMIKRPEIMLEGALEVQDSEAFKRLLKNGIGRHKSFGYGMLKVRRNKNG